MKRILYIAILFVLAGCSTEPVPQSSSIKLHFGYKYMQPAHDSLYPIYPNPFSRASGDTTFTIRFALKDTITTTVIVQNVLGDAVASFSDSLLLPGFYTGSWNPFASDGTPLNSGFYFVTLRAGDFINSRLVFIQENE